MNATFTQSLHEQVNRIALRNGIEIKRCAGIAFADPGGFVVSVLLLFIEVEPVRRESNKGHDAVHIIGFHIAHFRKPKTPQLHEGTYRGIKGSFGQAVQLLGQRPERADDVITVYKTIQRIRPAPGIDGVNAAV